MGSMVGSQRPVAGLPASSGAVSTVVSRLLMLTAVVGGTGLLLGTLFLPAALATNDVLGSVRGTVLDIPPLEEADSPPQNSYVYASDGTELAELTFEENRVPVRIDQVPQVALDAVLATEDADFFEHRGVNHGAIVRAALTNLRAGSIQGGASTITQQYVKQAYLTPEQTFARKIQEAVYATQLERQLTKEQILERYLNRTYFGSGVYGIGTASQRYFSKPVEELNLAEAATLAGVLRSPERNNPIASPENARKRRDIVLAQMTTHGFVTLEEAEAARAEPVELTVSELPEPAEPMWVDWVSRLLVSESAAEALGTQLDALELMGDTVEERRATVFQSGLRIHTTLDPELQELAARSLADHLSVEGESPAELAREPRGALVTVEPGTGAIRALAQGPHSWGSCAEDGEWADETDDGELLCHKTKVNSAVPGAGGSGRQPGSSFKPLLVTAALEDGLPPTLELSTYGPADIDGCVDRTEDSTYRVDNFTSGGPASMDMYEAVKRSNNVYHARLIADLGPEKAVEMGAKLGIRSPMGANCSLALGATEVHPLEMASAYATLANRGVHCAPFPISRIESAAGEVIWEHQPDCHRAIDEEVADRVVDIMAGPVESGGTAPAANLAPYPTRGKTGTTDRHRDAWFVGYVRQLATAAWVGYPADTRHFVSTEAAQAACGTAAAGNPVCPGRTQFLTDVTVAGEPYDRVTGGSIPARMWTTYMHEAVQRFEPQDFPDPGPLPTTTVPDLVSPGSLGAAERIAEEAGFRLSVRRVDHYRPAGTPVSQRPGPGTSTAAGSRLVLEVSNGDGASPQIPDVVGATLDAAVGRLVGRGYEVASREVPVMDENLVGRVVASSPGPGTRLVPRSGAPVVLDVGVRARRARTGGGEDGRSDRNPNGGAPSGAGDDGTGAADPGDRDTDGRDSDGRDSDGRDSDGRDGDGGSTDEDRVAANRQSNADGRGRGDEGDGNGRDGGDRNGRDGDGNGRDGGDGPNHRDDQEAAGPSAGSAGGSAGNARG